MSESTYSPVSIATDREGRFASLRLQRSALTALISKHDGGWEEPVLLHGPDASADIETLVSGAPGEDWAVLRGYRDLVERLGERRRFEEVELRLDTRYYDNLPHSARSRLADFLAGRAPLAGIIDFILYGPSGQGRFSDAYIGSDFIASCERLCNTTGIVLPWQVKNSLVPAFMLAVWNQHPRAKPLILHFSRRFGVPSGKGLEVAASQIGFEELSAEVERVYGMRAADVERAYRVWQLSRSEDGEKEHATTPRAVALETARTFMGVLTRARTDAEAAKLARQKPAPLMFELEHESVGLKHGAALTDPQAVIRRSAASLARRVERLEQDIHVTNVVPSAKGVMAVVSDLLSHIERNEFSDADVIELGLELNAFQWHVDSVKSHLADVSIGELTGLFATANLFLGRFPIWLDYTGSAPPTGRAADGVAAFTVARELLGAVGGKTGFLTSEASARIAAVLDRTPAATAAPALQEGLVRSAENFAAVTTEGASRVAIREAKEFGKKTKDKAYEQASSAIVGYVVKHGPLLFRLAELRSAPWLTWLHEIVGK